MDDTQRGARRVRLAAQAAQRANEAARKIANPQCVTPVNAGVTALWHSAGNTAAIHLGRYNVTSWLKEASRQLTECIRDGCAIPEFSERIRLIPDMDFIGRAIVLSELDYRPLIDLIEKIGKERAWSVLITTAEPESIPVTSVLAAVEQIRYAIGRKEMETRQEIIEKHNKLVPAAVLGTKFSSGRKLGTPGPLKKLVRKKIEALAKKHTPESKIVPVMLWEQFSKSPQPRGFEFSGNAGGHNANVWINAAKTSISYKRYANVVGEVKAELALSKKLRKIPD